MFNRKVQRKLLDIIRFPIRVKYSHENEVYFVGKLYDISSNGLCAISTEHTKDINENDEGTLIVWRVDKKIEIPVVCKWTKEYHSVMFYGFHTELNLYKTDLSNYMD